MNNGPKTPNDLLVEVRQRLGVELGPELAEKLIEQGRNQVAKKPKSLTAGERERLARLQDDIQEQEPVGE